MLHILALATDVGRIAEDGHRRSQAAQFEGNVPLRVIAIKVGACRTETTMHSPQASDTRIADALQSTYPEIQIGVNRVLYQYCHLVMSLQGVGYILHSEGVGTRAGTNPQDIDTRFKRSTDMINGSHFGSHHHTQFTLDGLQPG